MVDLEGFEQALNHIADKISEYDDIVHIGYYPTADCLIAASILGSVFLKQDRPFVIFRAEKFEDERDKRGIDHPYVFLGGRIDGNIENVIWIPEPSSENYEQGICLNAGDYGLIYPSSNETKKETSETEVTISLIVREICIRNDSTMVTNLLPLVAEQSIRMASVPTGLHANLAQLAESSNFVTRIDAMRVFGAEKFGIVETLELSYDPFFPNLTNNREAIKKFLKSVKRKGQRDGIPIEKGKSLRKFSELTSEELVDLNTSLLKYLNKNTGFREKRMHFFSKKVILNQEENYPVLHNTWDYAQAVQDVMNKDRDPLAIAVLLGNRGEFYEELSRIFVTHRGVLNSVFSFFKSENVEEMKNLRFFDAGEKIAWYNTSTVAIMILSSGLTTIDLPLVVQAPGPGENTTMSIQASSDLKLSMPILEAVTRADKNVEVTLVKGDTHHATIRLPATSAESYLLELNTVLGGNGEV